MSDLVTVHQAVAAVARDVGAVAKDGESGQGYKFRKVDDVLNALHGPLSEHGVTVVPYVVDYHSEPMDRKNWTRTVLQVEFHIYGPAGDFVTARSVGEAHNNSDKGPGVAMSYAYKTAMGQLFSLPTDDPSMDNEAEPVEPEERPRDRENRAQLVKQIGESSEEVQAEMRDWLKAERLSLLHPVDRTQLMAATDYLKVVRQKSEEGGDSSPVRPGESPPPPTDLTAYERDSVDRGEDEG